MRNPFRKMMQNDSFPAHKVMALPLSNAKSKNNLIGDTKKGRKVAFGSLTTKLMELINEMPSGG